MYKLIACVVIIAAFTACGTADNDEYQNCIAQLDAELARREDYVQVREHQIELLKTRLTQCAPNSRAAYEVTEQLVDTYFPYQYDKTIVYVKHGGAIARALRDTMLLVRNQSYEAYVYSNNGQYYMSDKLLRRITDTIHMDDVTRFAYYRAQHALAHKLVALDNDSVRIRRAWGTEYYYNSLLSHSFDPLVRNTYGYYLAVQQRDWVTADRYCDTLLTLCNPLSHDYAKAANHKAMSRLALGDATQARIWYVRSAINDVRLAIKDYGALGMVAKDVYSQDAIQRAMKYMRYVISDTQFYNSTVRAYRDIAILPQIESSYNRLNSRTRILWIVIVCVALAFVLSMAGVSYYIVRQNSRLRAVQVKLRNSNMQLSRSTESLKEANDNLRLINRRIAEVNSVKEAYMGAFMMIFSGYLNKITEVRRNVSNMLRKGNIDLLRQEYVDIDIKSEELKEFYALFDSVFLNLYPTFVNDINNLLVADSGFVVKVPHTLNTELRIAALIRLGFSDTQQIASVLHCSVNTVYCYRSRLNQKARVNSEDFETQIMQIGLPETV